MAKHRRVQQQQHSLHADELLVPVPTRAALLQQSHGVVDGAFNHVAKRQLKSKGVEVVFDPAKHKDFITGFRKRKQQRRKEAQEIIKKKEREARLEQRAEKRAKLKEELGLGDNWGDSDDEEEDAGARKHKKGQAAAPAERAAEAAATGAAGAPGSNVAVYEQHGTRTVVTTAPLALCSDDEPAASDDDEDEDEAQQEEDGNGHQHGAHRSKQHGKATQQHRNGRPPHQHKHKVSSRQGHAAHAGKVAR